MLPVQRHPIIFTLSGSSHSDKYLYEIGHRYQILSSFILKLLGKRTVTFFVEEKRFKLSIKKLVKNLDQTVNISNITKIFYIFALI